MSNPIRDLTRNPDAKPTSHLPSPAATPVVPGVSRPTTPPRFIGRLPRGLALRVARWLGIQDFQADVADRVIGVYVIGDLTKAPIEEETRTGADYKVFNVDMSVARTRVPIDGTQDMVIMNVALVALPSNVTFSLHIGDRDGIPFGGTGLGVAAGLEMQPPEQTRLLITNTAQGSPGNNISLLVSSGVRVSL